jgi:hypothetical protein
MNSPVGLEQRSDLMDGGNGRVLLLAALSFAAGATAATVMTPKMPLSLPPSAAADTDEEAAATSVIAPPRLPPATENKGLAGLRNKSGSEGRHRQRRFIVGIDLGATNAKAAVLDVAGNIIASTSEPLKALSGNSIEDGDGVADGRTCSSSSSTSDSPSSVSHSPTAVVSSLIRVVKQAVAIADANLKERRRQQQQQLKPELAPESKDYRTSPSVRGKVYFL